MRPSLDAQGEPHIRKDLSEGAKASEGDGRVRHPSGHRPRSAEEEQNLQRAVRRAREATQKERRSYTMIMYLDRTPFTPIVEGRHYRDSSKSVSNGLLLGIGPIPLLLPTSVALWFLG